MPGAKPLRAKKKELYARKRGLEGLGISEAYRATRDCSAMKTSSINSNAKKLERETPVKLRIEYLREYGEAEKEGTGRPTDFRDGYCLMATHLAKLGATDTELAEFFGCSESTLNLWKQKHPEFSESIKAGKIVTDMEVAVKLNERATGFEYFEAHPVKLKDIKYENGKKVSETERIEIVDVKKVIPPDTTAGIFWLTNRQRKFWKQRVSAEHTGADGKDLVPEANHRDLARAVLDILREAKVEGTKAQGSKP